VLNKLAVSRRLYQAYVKLCLRTMSFPPPELFANEVHHGVKHDQSFITYKNFSPKYFVNFRGYQLWIKADGKLKVGFASFRKADAAGFINGIRQLAVTLGCNEIVFMTTRNSSLFNLLTGAITPEKGLPICIRNLTEDHYPIEKLTFEYGDIDIF
jgi:hypothetical protein